jgi:PhzF family phenazine biosynthesis protein
VRRPFRQVGVFASHPYRGNQVAVVLDADGLTSQDMQQFAKWTNLSNSRLTSVLQHGQDACQPCVTDLRLSIDGTLASCFAPSCK